MIVLWRIGITCTGTVIGPNKRVHDAIKAGTLCILGRMVGRVLRRIPSNTVMHIDLHMGATTLDLHQAALRRLKRKNGDYED